MNAPFYTGERPCWGQGLFGYDEARALAPYRYAAALAVGKRVLDAGCGEGFGTRTLAPVAAHVEGIDYSRRAIAYCNRTWALPDRLSFREADLSRPESIGGAYELITHFQVIEHIVDDLQVMRALHRCLTPGGTLVLVTPNRLTSFSQNPYHVREYSPAELEAKLRSVFSSVEMLGVHGSEKVLDFDRRRKRTVEGILALDPIGLRRILPTKLTHLAFGRLAVLVRHLVARGQPDLEFRVDDFPVSSGNLEASLDLLAVCHA